MRSGTNQYYSAECDLEYLSPYYTGRRGKNSQVEAIKYNQGIILIRSDSRIQKSGIKEWDELSRIKIFNCDVLPDFQ